MPDKTDGCPVPVTARKGILTRYRFVPDILSIFSGMMMA